MFKVGDYLMYKTDGVCKVNQITFMNGSAKEKKKLYYVLSPVKDEGLKIYSAVDNTLVPRRPVLTKEEASSMIDEISQIPDLFVESEKLREDVYKRSLKSGDCKEWLRITKTIYVRKKKRLAEGKKSTSVDEYYMKAAEGLLLEELSVALGISESEVDQVIKEKML